MRSLTGSMQIVSNLRACVTFPNCSGPDVLSGFFNSTLIEHALIRVPIRLWLCELQREQTGRLFWTAAFVSFQIACYYRWHFGDACSQFQIGAFPLVFLPLPA